MIEAAGDKVKALALYSGGLDSILATRVVMAQGVEVEAVQFVTPFFNYEIIADIQAYKDYVLKQFGITVHVEDITEPYLAMLRHPDHGFGKNFNPCIDCKIMMITRAKELLVERGASFLISGEVLGQRPMSQRRDTLNLIERDAEVHSLLLRPLSAKSMPETEAELQGWVDRSKLYGISGRGRSDQIALAREMGISDYPAPAGGCILADPILSRRIKELYSNLNPLDNDPVSVGDVRSLLVGRQVHLPSGGWLVIGRDEQENDRLELLAGSQDVLLAMEEWPGPSAILKKAEGYSDSEQLSSDIELAASLMVRYARKIPPDDPRRSREVLVFRGGVRSSVPESLDVEAYPAEDFRTWILK